MHFLLVKPPNVQQENHKPPFPPRQDWETHQAVIYLA